MMPREENHPGPAGNAGERSTSREKVEEDKSAIKLL